MSTTPTRSIRVEVEMPAGISEQTAKTAQRRGEESVVLAVWQAGEISTRQAAEELGLSYHDFLDLLAERGIPVESDMFDMEALEEARRKLAGRQP